MVGDLRQPLLGGRPSTATRPPSFLQLPGAKEVGVEFNSLSKSLQLLRLAHRDAGRKQGCHRRHGQDQVPFRPRHVSTRCRSASTAVAERAQWISWQTRNSTFKERRDVVVQGLRAIGLGRGPAQGHLLRLGTQSRGVRPRRTSASRSWTPSTSG
ncbi:MAG: hypothetical protein MZV49_00235 [Rhodopseudomonas palustris]|nr:hypothetical protein [Rhodopseudomonas palustris]